MASATWLTQRITRNRTQSGITRANLSGLALLSGVGFTASLLISELSFGATSSRTGHVKVAVLTGSLIVALFGTVVLRLRNRAHRRSHRQRGDGS